MIDRLAPLASLLLSLTTVACAVDRPSRLPEAEPWLAVVKSAGLPDNMPWYSRFAEHTWVDVKRGDESAWLRAEVMNRFHGAQCTPIDAGQARRDWRWIDEPVAVRAVIVGERAQRIAERIEAVVAKVGARYADGYEPWPGPNSNTFMRELAREIPELAFAFDHNAVGKDYARLSAGLTPSRTGVQLDAWPFGVAIAGREGLELHLLQLTFAVRLFPPRIALPFLPAIPWARAPAD